MKLFSKVVENSEVDKTWKATARVEISIKAKNQGEAAYIADSTLSSIKDQSEYTIESIDEVSEMDVNESVNINMDEIPNDLPVEERITMAWNSAFEGRVPDGTEKMEFYHQLRELGFDGIILFNSILRLESPPDCTILSN